MKKSIKKVIPFALAFSMLSSVAMPVFADENIPENEVVSSDEELSDFQKKMNEYFKYSIDEETDGQYDHEKTMDKFEEILEQYKNLAQNSEKSFIDFKNNYELKEECRDENGNIAHDGCYTNMASGYNYTAGKALNGQFFRTCIKFNGDKRYLVDYFDTTTVDGINYITLDGYDFEYSCDYYDGDGNSDNECTIIWYNIPIVRSIPNYFYHNDDMITSSCEDAFNYYYINDKFNAYFNLDVTKFFSIGELDRYLENHDCTGMSLDDIFVEIADERTKTQLGYAENFALQTGDLDADGEVGIKDLGVLKKYITKTTHLTAMQKMKASTNGEAEPDIRDVTKMNQYLVKTIDKL